MIVSLLGLIASVAIVGGLIGMVGTVLSSIGFQRSKISHRGKGVSITGIVLGLFSIAASIGFVFLYSGLLDGGPEIVKDGVATHSTNTEFPPQDDIVAVTCEAAGSSARAIVDIENMSPGPSVYIATIEWETVAGNTVQDTVQSELIDTGETATLRLLDVTGNAVADSCKLTTIERTGLGFLN